jgi:hypothetical protein
VRGLPESRPHAKINWDRELGVIGVIGVAKRRKKNRNLGPRCKRMRRPARLQVAVKWRSGYGGKDIVRGYARWFGVDLVCAIVELRMLV